MRLNSPKIRLLACLSSALQISIVSAAFNPPQVFKNTNLLRTIELTRGYVQETIAAIVENTSNDPQTDYYLPIPKDQAENVSFVAARDKKKGTVLGVMSTDSSVDNFVLYKVILMPPVQPNDAMTIQINIGITNNLKPVPATIEQSERQFLKYTGNQYVSSFYPTEKQKTKFKFPNGEIPDYTTLDSKSDGSSDPVKSGSILTYGPYENVAKSGENKPVNVRFEYTSPLIRVEKLERDIEISHWGGNLAVEERYAMSNVGAKLKTQFSRLSWATSSYYNPPTAAIKQLTYNLLVGSKDAYFTDEIGNISTSRFRSNLREAKLELKPRFPLFGGWNSSFVVGWNNELEGFLRKPKSGGYVLKVPFVEGPQEPITYKTIDVRIILPEGATNVKYIAPIPITHASEYLHKTFLDTVGRTTLKLTVNNVVDELRNKDIIVSYDYSTAAALRKPLVVVVASFTVFIVSLIISSIDTSIGK